MMFFQKDELDNFIEGVMDMEVKENYLVGKDIMPTSDKQRTMSAFSFLIIWIGIAVQLVTFISASQLYPALSPGQIMLACLIGNILVAILLTLTGDIGIKYGIPYAVYIRACFGYLGTHIPSFIRALPAIFWFGFQTWMGAYALNSIMEILTGYSNEVLLIILFGIVQIINAAFGFNAIQKLEWIASPIIIVIGLIIQIMIMNKYEITFGELFSIQGDGSLSLGYGIVVMMGVYITMALNTCDFTRFLQVRNVKGTWLEANWGSFYAQSIGLLSSMLLFTLIGITSGVATGNWNPIDVIIETIGRDNPLVLILCLIFVIFAQWSSNVSANLMPPGYIIVNFFPRKINFATAAIIAGIVGLLIQPWRFADFTPQILVIITAILAPIVGIMICDYYLLRKRRLNIHDLYDMEGQYKYWKNINPAAIIAYIPACISAFLYPDYGFFTAAVISTVLYYLCMKFWIGKVYYQPEIFENYDNNKRKEEELI